MKLRMKPPTIPGLLVFLTFILTAFRFDAAIEGFLIEADKIHPKVFEETTGVLTVTFSELDYYINIKMEPAKLLAYGYTDSTSYEPSEKHVTVDNSKAISGIDYNNMIIHRFPIVDFDLPMVQIVYDVQRNLRAWVAITEGKYVRTSVGQLMPVTISRFAAAKDLDLSYDIFYLLKGKPRLFYQAPDESAASVSIRSADSFNLIPWRARNETVSSLTVTEMENGFAKVFTREGADGEPLFTGWVKIFVDGKLSIWEFETRGC